MNNTILIKLTDGGLVDYKDDVYYDVYYNSGCLDKILREFSVTEIKGN